MSKATKRALLLLLMLSMAACTGVQKVPDKTPEAVASAAKTAAEVSLALANAKNQLMIEHQRHMMAVVTGVFGLGFAMLAGAVVLFFISKDTMKSVILGACGICFFILAMTASDYYEHLARLGYLVILGGIGILGVFGLMQAIAYGKTKKEVVKVETAAKETVKLIDTEIKPRLLPDAKDKVFGDNGVAVNTLSPDTKALVAEFRKERS